MSNTNDDRGNWEVSFFQKEYDPNMEAFLKVSMKPENGFDPKNIHQYIVPTLSKEEQLLLKKQNNEVLKKKDELILNNYLTKIEASKQADIEAIKTSGFNAHVTTNEGRTRLLLYTLKYNLSKNNINNVANVYLRLMEEQFVLTPEIKKEYSRELEKMNLIIEKMGEFELLRLQFNEFHTQMPPLNIKGFKKLDPWQIEVIKNIDDGVSTIVNAPTSAGKSVLSGYATTKGNILFVVPTDALAWQMASYLGNITNTNVPILTATYTTHPKRYEMIEILNKSSVIVGTSDMIVKYLPYIKVKFDWIIFDEIHMIGKPEGSAMEQIAKYMKNTPILALSATIGNTDELIDWFEKISPEQKIKKVICNKRFFNLQRYYYDNMNDKMVELHPLALVEEEQFADQSILTKTLQPTPPDIWDLAMKIHNVIPNDTLYPTNYFPGIQRIELDQANQYFNDMIKYLANSYKTNQESVMKIINNYKNNNLESHNFDLVKLAFRLKEDKKTPAIIFQKNTSVCKKMVRDFAKKLENMENEKFPKLYQERLKIAKLAKRQEKQFKDDKTSDINSKKALKEMLGKTKLKKDGYGESSIKHEPEPIMVPALQEPHNDFILNPIQYFSEKTVDGWARDFRKYFENNGDFYHFMIKLLWRGVGVYAKGLPDPYLRLVQTLACMKQLAIVFSDKELVFGVSMPFRTVVIVNDSNTVDDLDSMTFHQMSGRAGRRGLDKEGNIVFAGYSWNRIKELSISTVPCVQGTNRINYALTQANKLSELCGTKQNWNYIGTNYLDKNITDEDADEFMQSIESNYNGGWSLAMKEDVDHLHMNWEFRDSEECVLVSFLIPYLRRAYELKDHNKEKNQTDLAHFLCRFISTVPPKSDDMIMEEPIILNESPYNMIMEQLEELQIDVLPQVDKRLYYSIQQNSIYDDSEEETDKLRARLLEFGEKLRYIQHYFYHSKIVGMSKIMGKLFTRIWWIYHTSSPITKPLEIYDE
jgi:superfamily II DNA or RNA helicase